MKKRISLATVGILLSMTAHAESVTVEHSMGKTTLEQNPQRVVGRIGCRRHVWY
ncbi:hypothetical protein VIDI103191_04145 [Vibrio diazotrophicus]